MFQRERYKDIVRRKEDLLAANAVGLGSAGCVGLCWLSMLKFDVVVFSPVAGLQQGWLTGVGWEVQVIQPHIHPTRMVA